MSRRSTRATRFVGACVLALLAHTAGAAQGAFQETPQLRVDVGVHTAFIKKLAASADGSLLLSVSDDKTGRLWDAQSGRLLKTLRVPIGAEGEGKLAAAAISRDRRFAAVGGFTGLTRGLGSGGVVYVFELRTARLVGGIDTNAPFAIDNLEFSPDGTVLAICQADGQGVLLYDWQNQRALLRDLAPQDKILGADFAANGDLAISTLDGELRVYAAGSKYSTSRATHLEAGRAPMHVKFAPDGRRLAVGFDRDPVVAILDSASLRELRRVRVAAASQTGLHVVEWSADGAAILAGGQTNDAARSPLYRIELAGDEKQSVVATLARRVSDLRRLGADRFAFASGEPELGVIDGRGRTLWRVGANTVPVDAQADELRVDASGTGLVLRSVSAQREWRVDLTAPVERVVISTPLSQAVQHAAASPTIPVRVAADRTQLWIDGHAVPLDRAERIVTWAEDARRQRILVGTSWSLRLIDRQGKLLWRRDAPDETAQIALTASGDVAVVAYGDGSLHWWQVNDGKELLGLLPHRNGSDWIAWLPQGYYMSSVAGDGFVGWQLNNGMDKSPDFYRAAQFERVFYRPDLVRAYSSATATPQTGPDIAQLRAIAPPGLSIEVLEPPRDGQVRVLLNGNRSVLPMRDWTLFVDGIPVTPGAARALVGDEQQRFSRELVVPVFSEAPTLRLEAFNGTSLGVAEEAVSTAPVQRSPAAGRLFLATVGVGVYGDSRIPSLEFPPSDATVFAREYAALGRRAFADVKVLTLADDAALKPTRANMERLHSFFAEATGADTVVLFLAAHGISDDAGNYYFLPGDARMEDVERALDDHIPGPSIVSWQFFFDLFRNTPGRRLLVVDTCSSGAVGGTFDVHSLAKRSMSSSFALITAAKGDEESQESRAIGHGIFTYGLIEAIRNSRTPGGSRSLSVSNAFDTALRVAAQHHDSRAGPQTPQMSLPPALASMLLLPD